MSESVPIGPISRHPVLSDDVYEAVRALIVENQIGPSTKLNIEGLARQLGVSPTPMREAMARLESDGLVVKQPQRGYTTTPLLSRDELIQLYEFRLQLEPWCAARAAATVTAAEAKVLREELKAVEAFDSNDEREMVQAASAYDARLHDQIAAMSRNNVVREALARTHMHLHVFRLYFERGLATRATAEHRAIVRAIASGAPDRAEHAMRVHLERAMARLEPNAD